MANVAKRKARTRQIIVISDHEPSTHLGYSHRIKEFVNQVAKINKGRVFYTTPDKLGQYILVDYVASRRKNIGGAWRGPGWLTNRLSGQGTASHK